VVARVLVRLAREEHAAAARRVVPRRRACRILPAMSTTQRILRAPVVEFNGILRHGEQYLPAIDPSMMGTCPHIKGT